MPVTLAKTPKPTGPVPVPFYPVIVTTRYNEPDPATDPAALRIAPARDLQDGDTVIGYTPTITFASLRAMARGTTTTPFSHSEMFPKSYRVDGHAIDEDGWVSLAERCFVWGANELVLYTPATRK
ncbi:hypothetical protein ACFYZ9_33715 [Streptomyces sp. NPDC001691]|uniref:hypothetical protein n=1 Tax=Streptomyces sp. NPDC001691 TaxID=3364600 RepID=UPI003684DBB6